MCEAVEISLSVSPCAKVSVFADFIQVQEEWKHFEGGGRALFLLPEISPFSCYYSSLESAPMSWLPALIGSCSCSYPTSQDQYPF